MFTVKVPYDRYLSLICLAKYSEYLEFLSLEKKAQVQYLLKRSKVFQASVSALTNVYRRY